MDVDMLKKRKSVQSNTELDLSAATATDDTSASANNKTLIFKRKMAVVSRKELGNIHRFGGSSHSPLLVSL